MKSLLPFLLLLGAPLPVPPAAVKPSIQYTLRVDSADLSGWTVAIRLRTNSDTIRLAMAAHPEYDDRYWRYVRDFAVETTGATVTRIDSAVWQIVAPRGVVNVRYRVALPPADAGLRASWRPFLTPTGGIIGGPHAFMYVLGSEDSTVLVELALPAGWRIATGLTATRDPHYFTAANAAVLEDSPILVGHVRQWSFVEGGITHRVVYWPLPDATPFDTVAFVSGIRSLVHQAVALFGRAPYREYTFQFEDGAYSGGLEHRNSVTLGARSEELAHDPNSGVQETAHEFVHTWNLMAIRPVEYRDIDYRTQPPVASLWFSEGLTMFYADLLLRRAGIAVRDSTRTAHLERLIGSYLNNPAYARFSAESISRVAYNVEPGALGDYSASTHLQGELIGTMLDLITRDARQGRRSMDDVMRLLFERAGTQKIDSRAIERAVETVCGCDVTPFFDAYVRNAGAIDFDRYLGLIGLRTRVTWAPAVNNGAPERDLRIYGWESDRDSSLRLVITNAASIWGRAGLHSRDQLVAMNGAPVRTWSELRAKLQSLRLGDTVRVQVRRPAGLFEATVVVAGFERATVRLENVEAATAQRRLAVAWRNGDR
ncbi:MAG TPA: PDZ domain-containing protein [Gemmatimonadales bacterium]|nr:PDZ domain-containing protein [Gemmatimonadales bacterium]